MVWSFSKPESLPEKQFFLWESLLEKRTGVQLAQPQQILLQTQVTIRMRELGIENYEEYFDFVRSDANGLAEWQILVDRLVVKETTFFRNRPSLELVRQFLQNRLSKQNKRDNSDGQKGNVKQVSGKKGSGKKDSLELWSVGCSTGEEPYALAAIAQDCYAQEGVSPYFGVTAIDISLPALSIARTGEYGRRSLSLLTDEDRKRYFHPCGKDQYRVNDSIKQRVCFSQLNILELKNKPLQPMDVIYCQNVLIYFRRWRRREILGHLVNHLKPGGILIIGSGEVTDWKHDQMERIAHEEVQAYVKYF